MPTWLYFILTSAITEKVSIFDLPNAQGSVETRQDLPSSREFFARYAKGWGTPVVLKNAAREMAAFKWTDETLAARFGTPSICAPC